MQLFHKRRVHFYLLLALLTVLSGCEKKSRFDASSHVDVCNVVPQADVELLLGPIEEQPTTQASGRSHAGVCQWTFVEDEQQKTQTLQVMLMTPAVSSQRLYMDAWYRTSIHEVTVSLGVEPLSLKRVGNEALLFENKRSQMSQIWMKQGQTYAIFMYAGGTRTDRLIDFAQAFSKRMEP
jgi:hypothetical protein